MSDRDGDDEIYTMNADGSNQARRTTNSISDSTPVYSPDGKQIVFTSDRDGNYEVYRMRTNGSLQTLLSNNPARDAHPDWQLLKR
jgi:Tol biopolymer transport system component